MQAKRASWRKPPQTPSHPCTGQPAQGQTFIARLFRSAFPRRRQARVLLLQMPPSCGLSHTKSGTQGRDPAASFHPPRRGLRALQPHPRRSSACVRVRTVPYGRERTDGQRGTAGAPAQPRTSAGCPRPASPPLPARPPRQPPGQSLRCRCRDSRRLLAKSRERGGEGEGERRGTKGKDGGKVPPTPPSPKFMMGVRRSSSAPQQPLAC